MAKPITFKGDTSFNFGHNARPKAGGKSKGKTGKGKKGKGGGASGS